MCHRIFDIEHRLDEAMFLFGGRQVGKSTLLKERFPKAVYIDLLNYELRNRFRQHPEEFRESLLRYPPETAVSDGEMLNYENVATDCGVSANTVKAYYKILSDTLLGFEVPAYRNVIKRKLTKASRFYFFDVGIANYLTGRHHLAPKTPEYGHAFKHLVMQEIVA